MPYVLVYNESASHPPRSTTAPRPATWSPTCWAKRIALVTGPTASDRARRRLVGARASEAGLDAVQHISMSSHTGSDVEALRPLRGSSAHRAVLLQRLAGHRRRRPGRAGHVGARRHLGLRLRRHALRRLAHAAADHGGAATASARRPVPTCWRRSTASLRNRTACRTASWWAARRRRCDAERARRPHTHGFFMLIAQITDLHAHAGRQAYGIIDPLRSSAGACSTRCRPPRLCSSPAT